MVEGFQPQTETGKGQWRSPEGRGREGRNWRGRCQEEGTLAGPWAEGAARGLNASIRVSRAGISGTGPSDISTGLRAYRHPQPPGPLSRGRTAPMGHPTLSRPGPRAIPVPLGTAGHPHRGCCLANWA